MAQRPERAQGYLNKLFAAMETGGDFDLNDIAWFNGGLFDGQRAPPLEAGDIDLLVAAGGLDWSLIDPSIFGTLFERFLDPDKRAQIGAHYTDEDKITKLIEPVILRPLREEWIVAKTAIEDLLAGRKQPPMRTKERRRESKKEAAEEIRSQYLERLANLRILDPACGSGNFLYLALQGVKDLENKVNLECEMLGLASRLPFVGPEILHGIEINPLAAELARTTIWISDIQWRLRNGIHSKPKPILRKLDAIECRDALLATSPTAFETFPFPQGLTPDIPAKRHKADERAVKISAAAQRLEQLREAWLNPPEWVQSGSEIVLGYPDRVMPRGDNSVAVLRTRTLTNLYNQRPQWLVDAHRNLDSAVAAAYGWQSDISEEDALTKLLDLNLSRVGDSASDSSRRLSSRTTPLEARRSPQFKLPIAGQKQSLTPASAKPAEIPKDSKSRSVAKRRTA